MPILGHVEQHNNMKLEASTISDVIDLDAYFERIGYGGPALPDLDTLTGIHRAHLLAIPYDALDIHLGREKTIGQQAFFDAIVTRGRGGWCYEMNGLLTTALRQLGFDLIRVGGAVARDLIGDDAVGNHMVGLVDLDGLRMVADIGLGDGPLEPFELKEGTWREGHFEYRLEKLDDRWWRFHNHKHGLAPTFDFTEESRNLEWYEPMCARLQVDEQSPFVNYAMAFRRNENGARSLRDTTLFDVIGDSMVETVVEDRGKYAALLTELLGVDLGQETDTLFEQAHARAMARQSTATD